MDVSILKKNNGLTGYSIKYKSMPSRLRIQIIKLKKTTKNINMPSSINCIKALTFMFNKTNYIYTHMHTTFF